MTDSPKQRITFDEVYMSFAKLIAKRSHCKRLQVGTVITTTDYRKVLAVGYNGNATGLPNTCDRDEPGNCGCLHSEENAAINCDAPRQTEKFVFVTHLPCPACAKRLINLGHIRKVVYGKSYRNLEAIDLLRTVGIEVQHFDDRKLV
jgi:dCMP deaminase